MRVMASRRNTERVERLADEDLLVEIARGDEDAFEALYDRHNRVGWSLALRLLNDRPSAEDVLQEAFLAVWRGSSTYGPGKGSVRTWLLSIVHHKAVDRLRQRVAIGRRHDALTDIARTTTEDSPDTADVAVSRVEAQEIRSALADVPEEQQQIITLAYYGGYSHDEIAQMLALPLGTVKSRMRLGLERVRKNIGAEVAPA